MNQQPWPTTTAAAPPPSTRPGSGRAGSSALSRQTLAQKPLAVIRLRGSQVEMGAQHAAALRKMGGYQELLQFYTELPERIILHADSRSRPDWIPRKVGAHIKDMLLRRLQRSRPKAYLERSRAFMEGLGLPAEHARFVGVMDVMQNIVGLIARMRLGPFSRHAAEVMVPACSTLMTWSQDSADGTMRHARNFDFPGIGVWDRGPAVVFCDPDDGLRYGFATSRGADTPGISAFNDAGISVTMHTRFHRDVSFDGAGVVDLGHEIVRRASTLEGAIAVARERPVASTWGIAVSSARERRAVVIEATAKTIAVVEPREGDHLTCANRYRHRDTERGQVAASAAWDAHSTGRQERLSALVVSARGEGGMTLRDMQEALYDRQDLTAPGATRGGGPVVSQPCTVQSIVIEPDERAIHISVAPAPTGRGPYARVEWDWQGPVGGAEVHDVVEPAVSGDVEAAYMHYTEACRLERQASDWRASLCALERAVELQPEDPSYRFLAGVFRMKARDHRIALGHFKRGLAREKLPLPRGQLLLWAARAADCSGDPVLASLLRQQLLAMDHDHLVEHRALAAREERKSYDPRKRKVQINLLIGDAW